MDRPRETWVPPEERREEWMMENTGEDSAHSFVYFPKVELNGFHCIEIPVGAKVYRGIPRPCNEIVDPSTCDAAPNKQCTDYAWYSDHATAGMYGTVYTFQTLRPLTLINLTDIRNIDRLLRFANAFAEDAWSQQERPGITEEQKQNAAQWKQKFYEHAAQLLAATRYPWKRFIVSDRDRQTYCTEKGSDCDNAKARIRLGTMLPAEYKAAYARALKVPFLTQLHEQDEYPAGGDPGEIEEELENLKKEFGDQTLLNRLSGEPPGIPNNPSVVTALQDLLPGMPIHGYYAPVTQNMWSTASIPYYHRELCLFQSANLVRHLPEDPLDGCVAQQKKVGGGRWPTRKHGHGRGRRHRGSHYTHKASTAGQKKGR